ncbi:MAG: hypothetical protein LBI86_04170 [Treponema sp.]|nr:hypothetical protein [Treponema sp.]
MPAANFTCPPQAGSISYSGIHAATLGAQCRQSPKDFATPTLKPHTPGEAALVKPAYRKLHKVLSRFIQVWIRGFPDVVTAKDLADLGIPPIDPTHTPVPQPAAQAEADVVLPGPHLVELWIKEPAASLAVDPDRPNHGVRIFWGVLGSPGAQDKFRIAAPPASGSDLPHSTFTRRKKYRFDFPEEDRDKTAQKPQGFWAWEFCGGHAPFESGALSGTAKLHATRPWSFTAEAVPKLQFLEQLLTPGENCISGKCLTYKELAIFSKSLFQN